MFVVSEFEVGEVGGCRALVAIERVEAILPPEALVRRIVGLAHILILYRLLNNIMIQLSPISIHLLPLLRYLYRTGQDKK